MTPAERFRAAVARHRGGDCAGAAAEYRALLDAVPSDVNVRFHLGVAEHQLRHLDAAALAFLHTVRLAPDFAEAWQSLAIVELDRGRTADAFAACRRALAIKPDLLGARLRLAGALLDSGREEEALAAVLDGLRLAPTEEALWRLLDRALDAVTGRFDPAELGGKIPPDLPRLVGAALAAGIRLKGFAINEVLTNCLSQAIAASNGQLLAALGALGEGGFAALEVLGRRLERQLAELRRAALEARRRVDTDLSGVLAGLAELACIQFRHEYVAAVSEEEQQWVDALEIEVASGLADGRADPVALTLYACYRPLCRMPSAERLQALPPGGLDRLLRLQVTEPLAEQALAGSIPRLTAVLDDTSRRVSGMYEENPYPRWQQLPADIVPAPSLGRYLAGRLAGVALSAALDDPAVDVLVAGCGTGRQVAALVALLPAARILAIDLSLPSLSYARRKLDELGARQVQLAHADILELAALPRRFPYIECAGVLHHLAAPIDGLRVLASLLEPGGILMLALYSRAARQHFGVFAAQRFARERGFPATPEGIRQFRAALESDVATEVSERLFALRDYYFLSQCRDLVFHEVEHCYTAPEIGRLCEAAELDFLGFAEPAPGVFAAYKARFPDDPARTDLDCWAHFEADAPATFIGMYTFYVRKPR